MAIARYPSFVIDCPDAEALATFYGALLGRKGCPWFADRMRATLAGTVAAHLPPPPGGRTGPDLVPAVLAAMSVQSITWWLDNGRPVPPRGIAVRRQSHDLVFIGVEIDSQVECDERIEYPD